MSSVAELEDRVLRALAPAARAHPRQSAIPRARLVPRLSDLENKTLVAGLLDRLKTRGKVIGDARTVPFPVTSRSSARASESSRTSWPRR